MHMVGVSLGAAQASSGACKPPVKLCFYKGEAFVDGITLVNNTQVAWLLLPGARGPHTGLPGQPSNPGAHHALHFS